MPADAPTRTIRSVPLDEVVTAVRNPKYINTPTSTKKNANPVKKGIPKSFTNKMSKLPAQEMVH